MKQVAESILPSYFELIGSLIKGLTGLCVLDGDLKVCDSQGEFAASAFSEWLQQQKWQRTEVPRSNVSRTNTRGELEVGLAIPDSGGRPIAVIGIAVAHQGAASLGPNPESFLRRHLKPALDCLHRELRSAARTKSTTAAVSERIRDLAWLFEVAEELKGGDSNERAFEHLLSRGTERLRSAFGALIIPGQKVLLQHSRVSAKSASSLFEEARIQVQSQVMKWVEVHRRPLILNKVGSKSSIFLRCKLLAVPVMPRQGKALGAMIFLNAPEALDFTKRQAFLATHIARHTATLLQSQYDLPTCLLTRPALEQAYESLLPSLKGATNSVLYVDIDQLNVINSVHGFAAGDDVIVRVANSLRSPILPESALVARISGDDFLIVLPDCDTRVAAYLAELLQGGVAQTSTRTTAGSIEITLSCGIGPLKNEHGGLLRGLVSAQTACQAAKERGRNRIETFASDDSSIMQRQNDALRLGSLREALRRDQFELYMQKIVPLRNPELRGGYEVLLRMRRADNTVSIPSEFLPAAERYQLMPSIDHWVVDNTLNLLESYVGVLVHRGVSFSVNVTAHSLVDDKFVEFLIARMRSSRFPAELLTFEITEQSAVRNLPLAVRLMNRLRELGCGVALDDFGTGSNSLSNLRDLPVTRVKIDGSFVREIGTNPRAEPTLKGIMRLIQPFHVDTVAEYVETEAVAERLRLMGIDYGQGYAFGKPEPMVAALQTLKLGESDRLRKLGLEI